MTTTIADLETHVGRTVIAALLSSGLNNVEAEPILYHGVEPDDCCPPIGGAPRVVVWWKSVGKEPVAPDCGGGGIPIRFGVRLLVCWPAPDGGIVPAGGEAALFGPTSTYLTRAAWVGYNALYSTYMGCGNDRRAQRTVVSADLGVNACRLFPVRPRLPKGSCAGVDWDIELTPFGNDTAQWLLPQDAP